MPKWEYCAIVGVSRASNSPLYPRWPQWVQFTSQGHLAAKIGSSEKDELAELAKTIARLGEEGWEMVGTGTHSLGNGTEINHIVYFKRPKT
jgi:hypothetical protein